MNKKPVVVEVQHLMSVVDAVDEFLTIHQNELMTKKGNLSALKMVDSKLCENQSMATRFLQKWEEDPFAGEIWLALKRLFHIKWSDAVVLKNSKQSVAVNEFKDGDDVCKLISQQMCAA